jgi:hypothetical protein
MPLDPTTTPPPHPEAQNGTSFDALVEAWHADHFPGSAVAQNTETWNLVFAAKEDLKLRLAAHFEQ